MKGFLVALLCLLVVTGCSPVSQQIATYTIDPNLLLTLEAIQATATSTTNPTVFTKTPTLRLSPTATDPSVAMTAESIRLSATSTSTSTRTKAPTVTRKPTSTPKPTRTKIPSKTPTETGPTATPAPQDAALRIYSPVSLSKVVSPIHLVMNVAPGSKGIVYAQITGEDNRIIYDRKWIFSSSNGKRTLIDEEIDFSLNVLSETAHLKVYTLDEFGRLLNLATEDFLLMSVGKNDLAEAEFTTEPFALSRPYHEQLIKNDRIVISGMARCRIDCRLVYEVVDTNGNQLLLEEQQKILQASRDYQPIDTIIPIKVNSPTWVRLILHQEDVFSGEDIAASSVVVRIMP